MSITDVRLAKIATAVVALLGAALIASSARSIIRLWDEPAIDARLFGIFAALIPNAIFGALLFFKVAPAAGTMAEQLILKMSHPGETWRWRADWNEGIVRDRLSTPLWRRWGAFFLWLLIVSPFLADFPLRLEGLTWIHGLAVLGVVLAVRALLPAARATWRRLRYGPLHCRLSQTPLQPGRSFRAEVDVRMAEPPTSGFQARLTCLNRVPAGRGENQGRETVVWERTQVVSTAFPTGEGLRVPVTFEIPNDAQNSGKPSVRREVLWVLSLGTGTAGRDFRAEFELPVFGKRREEGLCAARQRLDQTGL